MKSFLAVVLLLFFPVYLHASVVINEVMYNLEGTDSDREWIEIANTGSGQVDLSDWKFYENGSNHSLSEYQGGTVLGPGGFAVVVDSPDVFLADWPAYSGVLLDSSWSSFSNTGETFSLKNEDGDIVDEVTYTPEDGADGDGNSLQLMGGTFIAASPTPGEENQAGAEEEVQDTPEGSDSLDNSSSQGGSDGESFESSFGIPSRVFAGTELEFKPEVYNNDGKKLFKSRFFWSFGDGNVREDEYRRDFTYVYKNPGTYVVHLSVFEHSYSKEADHVYRQTLTVLEPSVSIKKTENGLSLTNSTVYEIDLEGWKISSDGMYFSIPAYTILLPGKSITLSEELLDIDLSKNVSLLDGEGSIIDLLAQKAAKPSVNLPRVIYRDTSVMSSPVEKVVSDFDQELVPAESQLANAVNIVADDENDKGNWVWYVIYAALLLGVVGAVAYVYFRDESEFIDEINGADKEAEDYTFE